jgi:hypothetical protein
LATGGALRPAALPRRAWGRQRSGADVDSAKETGARFRGACLESKASHQRARDQQAHLNEHVVSDFSSLLSHLGSHRNSHGKKNSKQAAKKRGQQAIDSDRAREIQEALIRERYMDGEPTGSWDDATQAAMQRYQADQGWQSQTTPDSRALIRLGLGPSHDHLLNPESAMTATTPAAPAAHDPKPGAKQTPAADNLPRQ